MQIIKNEIGAIIQSWDEKWDIPDDYAVWPDDLDTTEFYAYNGFVILTIEELNDIKTVVSYTPDVEAWEEWKKNNPEPEPENEPDPVPDPNTDGDSDEATYDEMAAAIREGVNEV